MHKLIPPRWLNCPRKGAVIADLFLPSKTPLDSRYDSQIPEAQRFTPQMLIESTTALNASWLIDLTNTTRFYDSREIESRNWQYCKVVCKGRDETPTLEQVEAFIRTVQDIQKYQPQSTIVVHCTHGFNRTGFLIIAFLVEIYNWELNAALIAFTNSRPPGIYKQEYLDELFRRYDDEIAPSAPPLPAWCYEEESESPDARDDDGNFEPTVISQPGAAELNDEDEVVPVDAGADAGVPAKRQKMGPHAPRGPPPPFAPPVRGVLPAPAAECDQVRQAILEMSKLCGWECRGFPGSQPVSLTLERLDFLRQKPYRVSWKADGTRYMMAVLGKDKIYMIDRSLFVYKVARLDFPTADLGQHLSMTLIDGEMVVDKVPAGKTHAHPEQEVPRYLMYDIVVINGQPVSKETFLYRHQLLHKEINAPRHKKMERGGIDKQAETFSVRVKDFWELGLANKLLDGSFAKQLVHGTDGLIFQPCGKDDLYKPGTDYHLLKWKPHELNSVDFLIKIIKRQAEGELPEFRGELYVTGQDQLFSLIPRMKPADKQKYDGRIVECTVDVQHNAWRILRDRPDKKTANHIDTVRSVLHSITNPVTKEHLYHVIYKEVIPRERAERQRRAQAGSPPHPL